jgi:hypothetical protein
MEKYQNRLFQFRGTSWRVNSHIYIIDFSIIDLNQLDHENSKKIFSK